MNMRVYALLRLESEHGNRGARGQAGNDAQIGATKKHNRLTLRRVYLERKYKLYPSVRTRSNRALMTLRLDTLTEPQTLI